MRYFNIDTVSFTDKNGNAVPVKDKRPISKDPISFDLDIKNGDLLDDIASRVDVYGKDGEDQSYKIFDANIIKIVEAKYNLNKLRKIGISL